MESAGARTATRPRPAAIGPPGNDATPLVSIIVCHTQPGGCLGEPEAIDSALRQPGGRVEILVVHDGATAPPIVDHPAVRYIQQEGSPAAARNRGVRESRGTFLVFLDPGDQLLPGALAAGLDHLLVDPTLAFVCGRARRTTDDGAAVSEDPAPSVADDPYATLLEENHIRVPATVMYRREVVASHGGFEELAADEYELQLRLARSVPVHAHAEIVVERRWCVTARRDEVERRLFAELEVVRAQRPHVANDQARRTAYEKGMSRRRSACAQALVRRAAGHLREGSGEQSLRAWLTAWRLSPAAALKATGWGLARQGRDRWKSVSRAFTAGVSRP